jgi:hypothetical protein
MLLTCIITACSANGSTTTTTTQPTSTQPTKQVASPAHTVQPAKKVVTPTSNPVCNEHTTNTPCVLFANVQDAAVGESSVGAVVHTGTTNGVTWVKDDITNVAPNKYSQGELNDIQFSCFNVQQAIWWGLKSTINSNRG